jgi:hypothetical protein
MPLKSEDTTKNNAASNAGTIGSAILLAALALPGINRPAMAEAAPDESEISLKYLDYRDWQPGFDRITVHSPSVEALVPIAGEWSVAGSIVSDSISGATPLYHSSISGASTMHDHRVAQDLTVTRYFSQGALSVGGAHSGEDDYQSRTESVNGTLSTESKNTSFNFGIAFDNDVLNPRDHAVENARKHDTSMTIGVTQVLGQHDIAQVSLSHTSEQGYLSDPYKFFDFRPADRSENVLALRWNHYFESTQGTARLGYRYYTDTWQIRSHTLDAAYVQPLPYGWIVTPDVRLYTQTAANFYANAIYDPNIGAPFPLGYVVGNYVSEDPRLSAFGAATWGMKVEKNLGKDFKLSFKVDNYEQRSNWALSGNSPGLANFYARFVEVGISKQW